MKKKRKSGICGPFDQQLTKNKMKAQDIRNNCHIYIIEKEGKIKLKPCHEI